MSHSTVAKRYAQSLFQLALQQNVVSEVGQDLQELTKALRENGEILEVLNIPTIENAKKKAIISEVFANANKVLVDTLHLLIDKKRINEIPAIAAEFKNLSAEAQGFAEATVYSTRPLNEEEVAEISVAFGKLVGKEKLNITNEVNPSLLGGVRVQIGNIIFDNTVVSKLEGLKRSLVG